MKICCTSKSPFAFALAAWMLISINAHSAQTGNDRAEPARRSVTVTGNGQTSTAPDRAVIHLGAAEQLTEAAAAQIEPRIVAYRAGNTIEITVEQVDLVGGVIDAGLTAGANQLQGISFGLKNDLPQRTRALALAAEDAEAKAQTIARALHVRLSGVLEITEGGVHVVPQREYFAGARAMAAEAMRTPVESGEVQVQATVTVRYEILGEK